MHQESAQIVASGFIKKVQETGQIPGCSFYLPVFMSRSPAVPSFLILRSMILRVFGWTLGSFILRLRATRSSEAHLGTCFRALIHAWCSNSPTPPPGFGYPNSTKE